MIDLSLLFTSGGDSVVTVSLSQEYKSGNDYWVDVSVRQTRPIGFCAGPYIMTPLAPGSPDTLFVSSGGMPTGAVC